jgi:hypothetical protein
LIAFKDLQSVAEYDSGNINSLYLCNSFYAHTNHFAPASISILDLRTVEEEAQEIRQYRAERTHYT